MAFSFVLALLANAAAFTLSAWGRRWWHGFALVGAVAAVLSIATASVMLPAAVWPGLGLLVRLLRRKPRNQGGDIGEVTAGERLG
jgi:hypothetical protein